LSREATVKLKSNLGVKLINDTEIARNNTNLEGSRVEAKCLRIASIESVFQFEKQVEGQILYSRVDCRSGTVFLKRPRSLQYYKSVIIIDLYILLYKGANEFSLRRYGLACITINERVVIVVLTDLFDILSVVYIVLLEKRNRLEAHVLEGCYLGICREFGEYSRRISLSRKQKRTLLSSVTEQSYKTKGRESSK
jgi:hypothetical protein